MAIKSLNEIIKFNNSFKTSINLYLSLNKAEKVLSYIPTKSSVNFLDGYMQATINNKEQATLLVGPYGKGKSHLLLVLLAILSMERTGENTQIIEELADKISAVDELGEQAASDVKLLWSKNRFLPVIINDTTGDLNQAFLLALNDALKREKLVDLAPDTYYSIALNRIEDWQENYPETYHDFITELKSIGIEHKEFIYELKRYSRTALDTFISVYPKITSGSIFNPLAVSEVLPLYKSVSERLVEDYGFSGIYIVFDEFSKFIEGLTDGNVGNNMKLLQDMCELATDSSNAKIFITMIAHKSIKEYGKYLSSDIINAFTGIEGRIVEKHFVTSSKNNYELVSHAIIKNSRALRQIPNAGKIVGPTALENYYQLPVFNCNFERKDFDEIILKGCYPLNPLATYLLLNISEKVAQNERTLFTFISNDEPNSMARYVLDHDKSKDWVIGADLIYDYFSGLFKKDVNNEFIHNIWLGAEVALSKCSSEDEQKVIKAMAVIQIVNKEDEVLANETYLSLAVRLKEGTSVLEALTQKNIIYRKKSTGAYVYKTQAGIELRTEIKKLKEIKGNNVNYGKALLDINSAYYIVPRKYNAMHSMTRYFQHEYMEAEYFLNVESAEVFFDSQLKADGKVITLFSRKAIQQDAVIEKVEELRRKNLVVVVPEKKISCEKELVEYEILQDIRKNSFLSINSDIAKREIPLLEEDIIDTVRNRCTEVYLEDKNCKVLAFDGKHVVEYKANQEENAVNSSCELVYYKTPEINNEIINRTTIESAQTKKSRLNIIAELLSTKGEVEPQFYKGTNQEATIFRALFDRTGIIDDTGENYIKEILALLDKFIDECGVEKHSLKEAIALLTSEPYGMRMGVIPIYFAYVLSRRHEDIVAYYAKGEIQITPEVVVNMCEHAADYSLFVSREDYLKEEYIRQMNELFSVNESINLTDNRIKNIVLCMQRWFRSLPQATRNLAEISDYPNQEVSVGLRVFKKILQKVEYNPYEIVFDTLPKELSAGSYQEAYTKIVNCKNSYDMYLSWVITLAVSKVYDTFDRKRKNDLYHVLKEWYEQQSKLSKQGLHSGRITNFMSCIEKLDVYDDAEVAKRVVKALSDIYIENWNDGALDEFSQALSAVKAEVETIHDEKNEGQRRLTFVGKNGKVIEKYYEAVDERTGAILRNILEDTLDEFDDLSVNDRVGILLEMIEKVIG